MSARSYVAGVPLDRLTLAGAVDAIERLVREGEGGTVLTPNVDHVVLAHEDRRFRAAYEQASLSLCDGKPVQWAARLLGEPVPEKVSGSDLVLPLLERAAEKGMTVFLFGGAPGSAERARDALAARLPSLRIAGVASPRVPVDDRPEAHEESARLIAATRPDLVLVGLGAPKQELFAQAVRASVRPAVLLCLGASIDFLAGAVPRAPAWMSEHGLEWLYRLGREPGRLWRRYLVRDPRFAAILLRDLAERRRTARGAP